MFNFGVIWLIVCVRGLPASMLRNIHQLVYLRALMNENEYVCPQSQA